jgi:hypothetical protein
MQGISTTGLGRQRANLYMSGGDAAAGTPAETGYEDDELFIRQAFRNDRAAGVADMISIPSSLMQDVIAENSVAVLPVYMSADNDAFYNKFWQPMYNISNRSNTVLEKLASAPAADRARIEGEAKFFRGFAYFNLARAFGTVPLILESYKFSTPRRLGKLCLQPQVRRLV